MMQTTRVAVRWPSRLALLGLLVACGPEVAPRAVGPAAASASPVKTAPSSAASPASAAPPVDRSKLPPFAFANASIEVEYPERVRVARAGRLYVEFPPVKEEDAEADKSVEYEPPVIEAASGTRPYRVLCRDAENQIAAYVPSHQLRMVAVEPVVLSPKTTPPETHSDTEPGVRVSRGAPLTVLGSLNAVDQVRFESIGLSGEGFARRVKLGHAFRPEAATAPAGASETKTVKYQAELTGGEGAIYSESDAARRPIAKLTPYPDGDGAHRFQRLGPKKSGFALVRLVHPETSVVGWIQEALLSGAGGEVTWSKEHKTSTGRLKGSRMLSVKKGSLLLGPTKREPVGVVLRDYEAPCIRRCESDEPLVAVRACAGVARVLVSK